MNTKGMVIAIILIIAFASVAVFAVVYSPPENGNVTSYAISSPEIDYPDAEMVDHKPVYQANRPEVVIDKLLVGQNYNGDIRLTSEFAIQTWDAKLIMTYNSNGMKITTSETRQYNVFDPSEKQVKYKVTIAGTPKNIGDTDFSLVYEMPDGSHYVVTYNFMAVE